jgi:hypothetical protein
MTSIERRRIAVRVLGGATVALAAFSVHRAADAMAMLAAGRSLANDPAFRYPPWALIHFVGATVFAVAIPWQLWAGFRERHRRWHRVVGRLAAAAGLVAGASGVALAYAMPDRPVGERVFMATAFTLLLGFLAAALRSARRRDFVRHRERMIRTAAIAFGPMAHRLVFLAFVAGISSRADFWDRFLASAWLSMVINLGVAEWWIRRSSGREAERRNDLPVTGTLVMESQARAG